MKKKPSATCKVSGTSLLLIATIIIALVLTVTPMKGYAALCAKPEKSTTYMNGYDAAQSDFRDGRQQNQNITSANSQYSPDYKQGYKDGWNDAQYHVNVIENSIC
jgi:hypothetical protein